MPKWLHFLWNLASASKALRVLLAVCVSLAASLALLVPGRSQWFQWEARASLLRPQQTIDSALADVREGQTVDPEPYYALIADEPETGRELSGRECLLRLEIAELMWRAGHQPRALELIEGLGSRACPAQARGYFAYVAIVIGHFTDEASSNALSNLKDRNFAIAPGFENGTALRRAIAELRSDRALP